MFCLCFRQVGASITTFCLSTLTSLHLKMRTTFQQVNKWSVYRLFARQRVRCVDISGLCVVGEVAAVTDTVFDLRSPVPLGQRIPEVIHEGVVGFDHNFCLNGEAGRRLAARYDTLFAAASGHVYFCTVHVLCAVGWRTGPVAGCWRCTLHSLVFKSTPPTISQQRAYKARLAPPTGSMQLVHLSLRTSLMPSTRYGVSYWLAVGPQCLHIQQHVFILDIVMLA